MGDIPDIKIPDIKKELARFSETSGKKQIKACLFTLIIYAHEPQRTLYFQELVNTILDKFPCRIIFIKCDRQSTNDYLHVETANVSSGQKGAVVICDQITITASKEQLFRIPYLVIPHIVPDLPVYLLWSQTPFEEKVIFPALHPYASRLIFDSECSDDLHRFCQEMQQNLDALKIELMDMNWALISNWRDMLVQLFDTPEKMNRFMHTKSITIFYNDTRTESLLHPEIRAIYLQGWLASSLKWNYRHLEKHEKTWIFSYTKDFPVIVALCPHTQQDLPPGAIISIDINLLDGGSYYIARKPSLSQAIVHVSSLEKCDLPYSLPLPNIHRGLNFMKEIFFYKLGNHYREMLNVISKIDKI